MIGFPNSFLAKLVSFSSTLPYSPILLHWWMNVAGGWSHSNCMSYQDPLECGVPLNFHEQSHG